MYINVIDLKNYLNDQYNTSDSFYISELVPHVGDSKRPITQVSSDRLRYNVFRKVYNTYDNNRQVRPLSFEQWNVFLQMTLEYFKRDNINVSADTNTLYKSYVALTQDLYRVFVSADTNTLYKSYVALTQDHRVSGLVNINRCPVRASQTPVFTWVPVGGKTMPIDILTYMSIFEKTFPNVIASYSAMKVMYNKYLSALQANGAKISATRPNVVIARHGSLNDIINTMGDIINANLRRSDGTIVSTNDLTDIISSNGNTRVDLTKYYQYMLRQFGLNTNNSLEMLKYSSDIVKNVNLKEGAPETASLVPTILVVPETTTDKNVQSII